jgi:hypothetical protein
LPDAEVTISHGGSDEAIGNEGPSGGHRNCCLWRWAALGLGRPGAGRRPGRELVGAVDGVSGSGEATTSMKAFWQTIGTRTWTPQVTAPGPANGGSDPSVAQFGSSAVVGVALSGGNGLFYWEANGKTPWHPESVN